MDYRITIRRIFLILSVLLLCQGCTTLRGRNQRLKVASDPEGADIILDGKVIGKTPAFVNVPREKQNVITLTKRNYGVLNQPLDGSYRWGDSFISNFVFVVYGAPVGWAIDLLTNTAWEYDHLPVLKMPGADGKPKPAYVLPAPSIIAIAPPETGYELLSDEVGRKLQDRLQARYPTSTIIPFDKTEQKFVSYSYNNYEKPEDQYKDDLYSELGVSHIIQSQAERTDKGVILHAQLHDVYTDQDTATFKEEFKAPELKYWEPGKIRQGLATLLNLVPNTITLDYTNATSQLKLSSQNTSTDYQGVGERLDNILGIISALGIRSTRSPKTSTGLHGRFRIIPLVTIGYDKFRFETDSSNNALAGYDFDWYTLLTGAGPELGLDSPIGYFYLDVVPAVATNWITGTGNGRDSSVRAASFTFVGEIGYQLFVSDRINLRLYERTTTQPSGAWSTVLSSLTAQPIVVDSAVRGFIALSLGYYFPEGRTYVKKGLF